MAKKVIPYGTVMGLPPEMTELTGRIARGADLRRTDFDTLIEAYHRHVRLNIKVDSELEKYYVACNNVAKVAIKEGEWFNYGMLEQTFLQKEAYNSLINIRKAELRAPYALSIFYHKTDLINPPVHSFYVITDTQAASKDAKYWKEWGHFHEGYPNGSFCIMEYRCELLSENNRQLGFMLRIAVETDYELFYYNDGKLRGYKHTVLADPLGLTNGGMDATEVNSCCDPVAIMLTVLNTKGVPVTRVEPPPKLNKARAKARKPLLLPYTVVDTSKYYEAAEKAERERMEALGDHRNSPIGHDRRGHPRRLRNGQTIWIRPMAINGGPGGGPRGPRDEYRIK